MSAPALRPVEVSLAVHTLRAALVDTDGDRADAVAELLALVGSAANVFVRERTSDQMPDRGLVVRAGIVPGGVRTGPWSASIGHATVPPLQLMAFCEAAETAPDRTLDQIQTAAYLACEGLTLSVADRIAAAMAVYRVGEPNAEPEDMGDDRHVFTTATLRCALYSLADA